MNAVLVSRICTGKFDIQVILHATVAGGVAMGTGCDLITMPFGSLLTGFAAGMVSALGYIYIQPLLERSKLRLHDTGGVHNLHGMPGIIGGIVGGICASFAPREFGPDLARAFPLVYNGSRTAVS